MYSALIVGCGRIAGGGSSWGLGTHAGALKSDKRFSLVAGVDSDFAKAQHFANLHQCEAFASLEKALTFVNPTLVSICTPDPTHYEIAMTVLSADKPPKVIFLEKPACATASEYDELVTLAASQKVLVVVNHSRRFSNKYRLLKKIISSGDLGALYRAHAIYYSGWMHNGTHVVDTLQYLLDDSIEWLSLDGVIESPYPGDPTLELTGYFLNGGAKVRVSAIDEALYQLFDFDFWFQQGRLRIEDFGSRIRLEKRAINSIGEQVLQESELNLFDDDLTEMQRAIGFIGDYLDTRSREELSFATLDAVVPTMKCLWQGKSFYLKTKSHEKN